MTFEFMDLTWLCRVRLNLNYRAHCHYQGLKSRLWWAAKVGCQLYTYLCSQIIIENDLCSLDELYCLQLRSKTHIKSATLHFLDPDQ